MTTMRVCLLGNRGMFGTDARPVFEAEGFDLSGGDLPEVDLADRASLARFMEGKTCDVVVNAAAFTNVDGAECQRMEAFRVNAQGVRTLAEACRERGVTLVHLSTDYVFPGCRKEGYRPFDATGPAINAYGESKLAGERAVAETLPPDQYLTCRTQWLYGSTGRNFVETVLKVAGVRGSLKVVNDQWGVPTRTTELARQICALLKQKARGYAHTVGGGGPITWYDFAREIVALSATPCEVEPCTSEEFPRPARRPSYAWLVNTNVPGEAVRDWRESLEEFLEERKAKGVGETRER
jgi:dTDP-4-dehydrorhamnose reductase